MAKTPPADAPTDETDLNRLLRLRVPVVVKLADKKMDVNTIMKIAVGAIIEFDKQSAEELELMIRDKVIGYGTAVKIGEKFGLRITSMVDVRETIQALGDGESG